MAVDEVEFGEFFASQYVRLCWLGLLLTGDRAEAEQLAQEALARTCGAGRSTARTARLRDRLGSPDLDPAKATRRASWPWPWSRPACSPAAR